MMGRRPGDQGIDDDSSLHRVIGPGKFVQEAKSGWPIGHRVPKDYREECRELPGRIVPVWLVLGERQTQEQLRAGLETLGIEGDLFESPDEIATNFVFNVAQIREFPEGTFDPVCHEGSVDLRQLPQNRGMTGCNSSSRPSNGPPGRQTCLTTAWAVSVVLRSASCFAAFTLRS